MDFISMRDSVTGRGMTRCSMSGLVLVVMGLGVIVLGMARAAVMGSVTRVQMMELCTQTLFVWHTK